MQNDTISDIILIQYDTTKEQFRMNTFYQLVSKRESCRDFLTVPVEQEKLIKIIETVRLAPSACNTQPWSFIVINKPEVSKKIGACLQDGAKNQIVIDSPAFIIVIEEKANIKAAVGSVLISQCALVDIGIATAYICLAAADLGLSTCILGNVNEAKLKKLLSINQTKRIRLVVCVGYAAPSVASEKIRKPMDEIVKYIV